MKKLNLKKKVISELSDSQKASIQGGGTTSYSECTGFLCCSPKGCEPASQGIGVTCFYTPGCECNHPGSPNGTMTCGYGG